MEYNNVNGIVPGGPSVVYESKDFTGKYGKNIDVNGGIVTIDGGTFNVPNYTDWDESDKGGACAVENDGGTVIINGGTFKSNTACYLIGNLSGTMTINGGDFSAFRGTLACEGGTMIVNDGKFAVTNRDQSGWVVYTEGAGTVTINGGQFSTVTGNMFSNPEAVTDNR